MTDWLKDKVAAQRISEAIQTGEKAQRRADHRLNKLLDILVERGAIDANDRGAIERIVA